MTKQETSETIRQYLKENKELILETALKYLEAGIAAVPLSSPLRKDIGAGKAVLVEEWQLERLTSEKFTRAFNREWREHEGANLGVVTGTLSGFVCLDIDARHGGMLWY